VCSGVYARLTSPLLGLCAGVPPLPLHKLSHFTAADHRKPPAKPDPDAQMDVTSSIAGMLVACPARQLLLNCCISDFTNRSVWNTRAQIGSARAWWCATCRRAVPTGMRRCLMCAERDCLLPFLTLGFAQIVAELQKQELDDKGIQHIIHTLRNRRFQSENGLLSTLGNIESRPQLREELKAILRDDADASRLATAIQKIRSVAEPERRLTPRIDEYSTFKSAQLRVSMCFPSCGNKITSASWS